MTQKPDFQFDPSLYHARAEVQIRFNDIDILGHLNNVQYFSLFDTAKAQYLQQVMRGDIDWRRVETVIANIDCDFIASAYYGEPIEIYTRCIKLGKRAFTLEQVMVNASNLQVKAVCRTVMVSYDPDLGVTVEISDRARDGINALERNQCRI
ncbi:MAG: acyl-CoA thioesterase [Lepagella sp.]|jgi:hypothetical protein